MVLIRLPILPTELPLTVSNGGAEQQGLHLILAPRQIGT